MVKFMDCLLLWYYQEQIMKKCLFKDIPGICVSGKFHQLSFKLFHRLVVTFSTECIKIKPSIFILLHKYRSITEESADMTAERKSCQLFLPPAWLYSLLGDYAELKQWHLLHHFFCLPKIKIFLLNLCILIKRKSSFYKKRGNYA